MFPNDHRLPLWGFQEIILGRDRFHALCLVIYGRDVIMSPQRGPIDPPPPITFLTIYGSTHEESENRITRKTRSKAEPGSRLGDTAATFGLGNLDVCRFARKYDV